VTPAGLVPDPNRPPRSFGPLVRIGVLAFVLAASVWIARSLGWFDYEHTLEHVNRLRRAHSFPAFTTTFVLASALGMAVGLPGMPFVAAAGAIFGTFLGSVLGWVASVLGAIVGYWIARTVGHDIVLRWVKRFHRIDAAVAGGRDFGGNLVLRLLPVLPIGAVNFIAGLARAPFLVYLAATAIGIIPATVIYAYFADSLLEGVGNGRREALKSLIIASVLLAALSLTPAIVRWRKRREARAHPRARVGSQPHPSRRP
jgi:uncharacterized membrane protein YdjX (TVP38/TMEM64 family)